MAFFQHFLGNLKEDVIAFMNEFFSRGRLSKGMDASFISLIPNKEGEISIKDCRPISLIGSVYKILAKVLAGRIQKVLPNLISVEQGAFVKGRQILDGVFVANECVHSRNKDRTLGLVCKLDLEKAYDKVDWWFLQYLLGRMGFGTKYRRWIQECISYAFFSIVINGSLKSFIEAQRGLRQGDPLSPFLFVAVAEALSRMMKGAENAGLIRGFEVAGDVNHISHLQFADNTLIFLWS